MKQYAFFSAFNPPLIAVLIALMVSATVASADGYKKDDKPALQLKTTDGRQLTTENAKGKVIILHFWVSYDKNSRDAARGVNALSKKYGDRGVQVVGVSLDNVPRHLDDAVRELKIDWPQVLAEKQEGGKEKLIAQWGMSGTPDCFVIGADGKLLWHGHPSQLDEPIKEALKADEVEPGRWTSRLAAFEAFDAATQAMRTDKPLQELPGLFAKIPEDALTDPQVLERASSLLKKLDSDDVVLPVLQSDKAAADILDRLRTAVDEYELKKKE